MPVNLLKDLLSEKIKTIELRDWLRNGVNNRETQGAFKSVEFSPAEFVQYFLNFVHDETCSVIHQFSYSTTPSKITPKNTSLGNIKIEDEGKRKFRMELFPELKDRHAENLDSSNSCRKSNSFNHSTNTSTPDAHKNKSNRESDISLCNESKTSARNSLFSSPISPIYNRSQQRNFSTPVNEKSKQRAHSAAKSSTSKLNNSFCLGDFIVSKKANSKKKQNKSINISNEVVSKENCQNLSNNSDENLNVHNLSSDPKMKNVTGKRINPTKITDEKVTMSRKFSSQSHNSFMFQTAESEIESHDEQRNILKEERLKILSRKTETNVNEFLTPRKMKTSLHFVQPHLESVTFKRELDIFIEIYDLSLNSNLLVNVTTEYYFLFSLLLCQHESKDDSDPISELRNKLNMNLVTADTESCDFIEYKLDNSFKSIHNCIYFASNVLLKQTKVLNLLDRTTLKMLYENQRLMHFVPSLTQSLTIFYNKKLEKKSAAVFPFENQNVSFISDTDNRDNFPSVISFQSFKKQRDLFYEVLRLWQKKHVQDDWNFSLALGGKIRALLNISNEPTNYVHLARLFKAQLLSTSEKTRNQDDSESHLSFFNSIPNINAEKLSKLKDRLVTKQFSGDFNQQPTFSGQQEFYKDFIVHANSPIFNKNLIDCFVNEITQLDETVFWSSDVEESGGVDITMRNLYKTCVKSLRLLAKFLGFVESLPYKSNLLITSKMLTSQLLLRQNVLPSFDSKDRLLLAIKNNKLILTLPWLVKYLALLDYISLRSPHIQAVIEILFDIYHQISTFVTSECKTVTNSALMITFCLGWLFEQPNFPQDHYYVWLSNKHNLSVEHVNNSPNEITKIAMTMDDLELVDESILYLCCPILLEIKALLSSDPSYRNNKSVTVRYIRPISAVQDSEELSRKRLQSQLEEAFFHGHPMSIRKTVEFVSERVASVCVKNICNIIVPEAKHKSLEEFKKYAVSNKIDEESLKNKQVKESFMKKARELSEQCFNQIRVQCKEQINALSRERCESGVKALLSSDVHQSTNSTCVLITVRICRERIDKWFDSHVNTSIFLKELNNLMDEIRNGEIDEDDKYSYDLPPCGRDVEHRSNALPPTEIMEQIRDTITNVVNKTENLTAEFLSTLLENIEYTFKHRCDLSQGTQHDICMLLVDLSILLIAHKPEIITEEQVLNKFLMIWKNHCTKDEHLDLFPRILCPRNAEIFEKSNCPANTWDTCASFLICLLKEDLLSPALFEEQALSMLTQDWSLDVLQSYTDCLRTVAEDRKRCGYNDKFAMLLNWISDYCNDDEFFF